MRILLAEDDASQAESIKTWLEMDGYSVDWVERGDHAILAIEQHHYDCVLLDRGLPHATGDDILLKVRGKNLSTPVIFLTARDSIRDRVEGLDLGANDYLVKPFAFAELLARVRTLLRRGQQLRDIAVRLFLVDDRGAEPDVGRQRWHREAEHTDVGRNAHALNVADAFGE